MLVMFARLFVQCVSLLNYMHMQCGKDGYTVLKYATHYFPELGAAHLHNLVNVTLV